MLRGFALLAAGLAALLTVTWGWMLAAAPVGGALAAVGSAAALRLAVLLRTFGRRRTLASLAALAPGDFERAAASWLRRDGWRVEVRGGPGDRGIDLVATAGDETLAVQCKRYAPESAVSPAQVRELYGAATAIGATGALLVTTGRVSAATEQWAAELDESAPPLDLFDGVRTVELATRRQRLRPGR